MSGRRGFLALVGGSMFSGALLRPATATQPTLILPAMAPLSPDRPSLGRHRCQMDAFLEIGVHVPKPVFLDWLESGLQLAELHRRSPEELERNERRIKAALSKHGGFIEAMRAGAL